MTSRDIGARVARVREGMGLSMADLAGRVGVSQAQISRLENGKQGFRSSTLAKIAESLGIPPFYLLMNEGEWETYQAGLEARGEARLSIPVGRA